MNEYETDTIIAEQTRPTVDRDTYEATARSLESRIRSMNSQDLGKIMKGLDDKTIRSYVDSQYATLPDVVKTVVAKAYGLFGTSAPKILQKVENAVDAEIGQIEDYILELHNSRKKTEREQGRYIGQLERKRDQLDKFTNYKAGLAEDLDDIEAIMQSKQNGIGFPDSLHSGTKFQRHNGGELAVLQRQFKSKIKEADRLIERVHFEVIGMGRAIKTYQLRLDNIDMHIDEAYMGVNGMLEYKGKVESGRLIGPDTLGMKGVLLAHNARKSVQKHSKTVNVYNEEVLTNGGPIVNPDMKNIADADVSTDARRTMEEELALRKADNAIVRENAGSEAEAILNEHFGIREI